MIDRHIKPTLNHLLDANPAVVLIGPRQVGKTTLAREVARERNAIYLDLERPSDLAKIADVESYCEETADSLLVLDEIHRAPGLFAPLRSIIDERRQAGKRTGQFLLLGSASIDLLKQSSETLAGRVAYCELHALNTREVPAEELGRLWCRGGLPDSYLAPDEPQSLEWRLDFIRTYLERDIPQFGPRIPAETLRRFWTMLAHNQGQTHNAAALARGLEVNGVTIARYLDLLVDLLLVRRLPQWTSNLGRRLVKAPKVYAETRHLPIETRAARSSGHRRQLGRLRHREYHQALPRRAWLLPEAGGAEVDLVIDGGAGEIWAVEVKRSSAPAVSKGFHSACEDLRPTRKFFVHAGRDSFPLAKDLRAMTLPSMVELAVQARRASL